MSDDGQHSNHSDYEQLKEEIRRKPGLGLFSMVTAAPFAVLIGLLAIFVPREFDNLRMEINEASAAAEAGRIASVAAETASLAAQTSASATLSEFRALRSSIAEANARPVFCPVANKDAGWMGASPAMIGSAATQNFKEILPSDLFDDLCDTGLASAFMYSKFDGQDWVFVEQVQFNQLDSDLQEAIETSFERFNVNFTFAN